ncbi:hypothetical protein [Epilithonimonas tenax]|uniref:hypothetical protein n=1 Tax=Epilithonimonas tenax TaxID=191577 RepID=UPI0004246FE1|nr:hypothetical protein [Epilithonimonas tenax]
MRKLTYTLLIAGLFSSCSKLKKDAQTVADLKCLALDAHGDKRDRYEQQIEIIGISYTGSDLVELEKQVAENFKKCPAKILKDKEDLELEKAIKETSSNNNVDEILNDYEKVMNEYTDLYQKTINGDIHAMNTYPDVLDKAQELDEKISKIHRGEHLSSSQIKRMNKLNMKLYDAMSKE